MAPATLVASAVTSFFTALAFAAVSFAILRRTTNVESRRANQAAAIWWGALAGYLLIQGTLTLAAAYDALTVETYVLSRIVTIPLLCGAAAGLLYHLTYVYTGSPRLSAGLALLYVPTTALFFYANFGTAQTLHVSDWLVSIDDSTTIYRIVYLLVGLPPIIAAVAYLNLLRRVREPERRYRIILVATTIIAYLGSGLAARLALSDEFKFLTLVGFGFLAGLAILAAYYPPQIVKRRLEGTG